MTFWPLQSVLPAVRTGHIICCSPLLKCGLTCRTDSTRAEENGDQSKGGESGGTVFCIVILPSVAEKMKCCVILGVF